MASTQRILRYLSGTTTYGIFLQASTNFSLTCYVDADSASCPDDRRNTSGYSVFLDSILVSWISSKQKVVSWSIAESEYRSLANAAVELSWLQSLLSELHILLPSPPTIFCNNLSTTIIAAKLVMHSRIKHIEIDYHFVQEKLVRGSFLLRYLPS